MALDIEKCKECYYSDEDGVCDKCCLDNSAFEPKRPNERVLEWISVKDRLPVEGSYILAYSEHGSGYSICVKYYRHKRFWNSKGEEVTHWMPLPEPPKGE